MMLLYLSPLIVLYYSLTHFFPPLIPMIRSSQKVSQKPDFIENRFIFLPVFRHYLFYANSPMVRFQSVHVHVSGPNWLFLFLSLHSVGTITMSQQIQSVC